MHRLLDALANSDEGWQSCFAVCRFACRNSWCVTCMHACASSCMHPHACMNLWTNHSSVSLCVRVCLWIRVSKLVLHSSHTCGIWKKLNLLLAVPKYRHRPIVDRTMGGRLSQGRWVLSVLAVALITIGLQSSCACLRSNHVFPEGFLNLIRVTGSLRRCTGMYVHVSTVENTALSVCTRPYWQITHSFMNTIKYDLGSLTGI